MPKTRGRSGAGGRGRQWGANQIGEHAKPEEADQADAEPDRQDASHPPMRILSARIHFHCAAHPVAGDIGQRTRRKTMAEQVLKSAAQGLGLVIARRLAVMVAWITVIHQLGSASAA